MTRQRGVALVEFALILPFLLVMLVMTAELGRAIYHYGELAKSVREAARYLSVRAPGTGIAQARNIVVYGRPEGASRASIPGLSASNVPDPVWATTGSYPTVNTVTVTVQNYRFVPMLGNVFGARFEILSFGPIRATMRSPT
ncbi:TadE/TadG family type IV pilus assembly protein [Massilia sp. BHUDP2]|uniref:TadE/TadG family type IV pilus assembly protein n=1 Tax=Massilia sp. BHUDP2 TaxID=3034505 RepID=UPI001AE52345